MYIFKCENYQYFVRKGQKGGHGNRVSAYGQGHLCKSGMINCILVTGEVAGLLCKLGFSSTHETSKVWQIADKWIVGAQFKTSEREVQKLGHI